MILRMLVLVLFVFVASCAHAPVVKKVADLPVAVTGSVLNQPLLAQGGDLALVPFKAGPGAEANDELDRISLMVIKGIKDSIEHQNTSFRIVDATDSQPKIALQGYVQEFSKSRRMMGSKEDSLNLVGEVWLISTGERILNFSTQRKFNPKKEKPTDAAYELGHEIGDFIIFNAKSKESL